MMNETRERAMSLPASGALQPAGCGERHKYQFVGNGDPAGCMTSRRGEKRLPFSGHKSSNINWDGGNSGEDILERRGALDV